MGSQVVSLKSSNKKDIIVGKWAPKLIGEKGKLVLTMKKSALGH